MHSSNPTIADPSVEAALSALEIALTQLRKVRTDALGNRDRLLMMQRVETVTRALPAVSLELVAQLDEQWDHNDFATHNVTETLAEGLRISPAEARARWYTAQELAHRIEINGEILEPVMAATAAAHADGAIGPAHVKVLRDFRHRMPSCVDAATREQAETELAAHARILRPDQLRKVADRVEAIINPDGTFSDADRARRRTFTLGRQGPDHMSKGTFAADPELRAYLDAIFAKLAKPGMCNPNDITPAQVDGEPDDETADRDTRSPGQRQHDALKAVARAMLASGQLGQHRGLPVSVVVTTTLQELEDAIWHPDSAATTPINGTGHSTVGAPTHTFSTDRGAVGAPTTTHNNGRTAVPTHSTDRSAASTSASAHGTVGAFAATHGTRRTAVPTHGTDQSPASALVSTHGTDPRTASTPATTHHTGHSPVTSPARARGRGLQADGPPVITGGGSLLPIHDLIRMAAHARHYLAIFDHRDGRPLYLARTKRIATDDQRIVLHARDIGCSYPGCAKPGYLCQTHHRAEWANGGPTDVDQLTFACEPHHRLVGNRDTDWSTIATPAGQPAAGRTQWFPPSHIDPHRTPRTNHYHHPAEYLDGNHSPPDEPE